MSNLIIEEMGAWSCLKKLHIHYSPSELCVAPALKLCISYFDLSSLVSCANFNSMNGVGSNTFYRRCLTKYSGIKQMFGFIFIVLELKLCISDFDLQCLKVIFILSIGEEWG